MRNTIEMIRSDTNSVSNGVSVIWNNIIARPLSIFARNDARFVITRSVNEAGDTFDDSVARANAIIVCRATRLESCYPIAQHASGYRLLRSVTPFSCCACWRRPPEFPTPTMVLLLSCHFSVNRSSSCVLRQRDDSDLLCEFSARSEEAAIGVAAHHMKELLSHSEGSRADH